MASTFISLSSSFPLLLVLLLSLSTFLPSLFAQPPPPPPQPSTFHEPDAVFHGYDIKAFAVDPQAPYLLVNDAQTFLHSVDLTKNSRSDNIFTDPTRGIEQIAISRRGTPVIGTSSQLIFFDDQWRPRYNISLRSVDSRVGYWFTAPILVDSNDYLYLLGFQSLFNRSYIVNVLDREGVRRDSWIIPYQLATPVWCMDVSNNLYVMERMGASNRPLYIYTSGGVLTDTLRANLTGLSSINAIAVSRDFNIFLSASRGSNVLLAFDASFRLRGQYSLSTIANSINQLTFDSMGNLWVLDEGGQQILAIGRNGDLLGTVSSDTPNLYGLTSIQYDRSTDSILFTPFDSSSLSVQRIDGRNGGLIQSYGLPDRLSNCRDAALGITGDSNIWILLNCFEGRSVTTRIHVINRAGKIQREIPLVFPAAAVDMVIDPYDDRIFVTWSVGLFPFSYDYVEAYSLDGVPLFNLSLSSIKPAVTNIQSMSLAFGALQVLEYDHHRITYYSISNGTLLGSVPLDDNVVATGLLADKEGVFVARYDEINDGRRRTYNSSILHLDYNGTLLGQYIMGSYTGGSVFTKMMVNEEGNRLYGFDELYGSLAVWEIGRGPRPPPEVVGAVKAVEPMEVVRGPVKGEKLREAIHRGERQRKRDSLRSQ